MMSEKWTPGPWLMQQPERDGAIFIVGDDLGGLVGAALPWPTEAEQGGSERVKANARLMVAAPDLAEVVQSFIDETVDYATRNNLGDPEKQHNVKWGRAVLAKARGEA